jgi:hypothetical protein
VQIDNSGSSLKGKGDGLEKSWVNVTSAGLKPSTSKIIEDDRSNMEH